MSTLERWKDNHAISTLGIHLIWCTKYRREVINDSVAITIRETIGLTCKDNRWAVREIEVMPDHVHCFMQLRPTDTPSVVVKTLKSVTAIAVFTRFPNLKGNKFWGSGLWSRGAYYGSVGTLSQETVSRYIQDQTKK